MSDKNPRPRPTQPPKPVPKPTPPRNVPKPGGGQKGVTRPPKLPTPPKK